jgi:SAM-dependent methyltransferase
VEKGSIKGGSLDSLLGLYRRSAEAFREKFSGDPMTSEFLFSNCLAQLRKALEIVQKKDLVFLELGCGVGLNPVIASELGLKSSYGVEINPRLIEEANRNLALALEKGLLSNGNPPVYKLGNFFTKGQLEIIKRELGGYEYKHLILDNPYPGSDVYEQLGVGFDEVDVFYMYPWYGKDFGYFLRFFREHAKEGALLLLRD